MKAVPANQIKKQLTAEDILSEVLDESGNKAVEEYDAYPRQVVQKEKFEQEGNNQHLFKSVPAKREADITPFGMKESAPVTRNATLRPTTEKSKNVFVNRAFDIISDDARSVMTNDRFGDSRPASAVTEKI